MAHNDLIFLKSLHLLVWIAQFVTIIPKKDILIVLTSVNMCIATIVTLTGKGYQRRNQKKTRGGAVMETTAIILIVILIIRLKTVSYDCSALFLKYYKRSIV